MPIQLKQLQFELKTELDSILGYWSKFTIDTKNEGFIGQIDHNNQANSQAEKGSVLNARILWTFSSAYELTKNEEHKKIAKRAFDYIVSHFYDTQFGGIFWSLHCDGTPKDTKTKSMP